MPDSVESTASGNTPLRVGCVKYLNARPLVRGWPGTLALDHPAVLCARLAAGDLDVALVSSFEFLRNPIYKIVDDVAIASDGPVYSVLVASPRESHPQQIELDPASITGLALLKCLFFAGGKEFAPAPVPQDTLSPLTNGRSRFLIGDQAIRFRQTFGDRYDYLDLGKEWRRVTGLPFVYALWLIRPEVADSRAIAEQLRDLRDKNLSNLETWVAAEKEFDREFCVRYFREHLRFTLAEKEKEGVRAFHRLSEKSGLLPERAIEFSFV